MTIYSLKGHILHLAQDLNLHIEDIDKKTESEILCEVSSYRRAQAEYIFERAMRTLPDVTAAENNLIRLAKKYDVPYNKDNINYAELRDRIELYQLSKKAKKYGISYDENNTTAIALGDKIEDYELLLSRANELGIDWEESNYDPTALGQLIKDEEHKNFKDKYETIAWLRNVTIERGV